MVLATPAALALSAYAYLRGLGRPWSLAALAVSALEALALAVTIAAAIAD